MKVPEAELLRIKREVSIVALVEARGIKLTGEGDNLMGHCPFHRDRKPSLVVSPVKNIWNCLGSCKSGGSVIDWVMKSEKVSFRLAVEKLRKSDATLNTLRAPSSYQPQLEALSEPEVSDEVLLVRTVEYYHRTLKEAPEAYAYLEKRGLKDAEMVEHFKIGHANRTLGYRIPDKRIKSGAVLRRQLESLGIFRKTGHEHFSGCITIPVFSEDGRVMELYGRKLIDGHSRVDAPRHLYLPKRPEGRGVFNVQALSASKEIILCEALLDALTFWKAGFRNVTSAYGVNGFTPEIHAALKRHGTTKLLIAYDRDEAGDGAAEALAKELGHHGLEVFRVRFPRGMDANSFAQKMQPAEKSLELVLRSAEWMAGTRPVPVPEVVVSEPSPSVESPPVVAEPPPLLAASSEPGSWEMEVEVEVRKEELRLVLGTRSWRVRGLSKNTSYETLRVNLLVAHQDVFFVDTLELYSARQRSAFLKEASAELRVDELTLKSDLGRIVLWLEDRVHDQISQALTPKRTVEMSAEDRSHALELLRDPNLLNRILFDFDRAGVVGEEPNKLLGYLAAVSRKLESPLAVIIQSSSAAGKSSLMDAVLRFVPEEDRVQYSAMTGQSLFYMGEQDLQHKVLAIAEEEGAESASYALKLLQSEGELTIASTGKDPVSGKHVTHEYRVKGPVMLFLTTTSVDVDEELLNRCLVLTVDEGAVQTSAIHERQRASQTLEGLLARQDREVILAQHQNAQRLLEPLFVVNPHASSLRFESRRARSRRDHMKYLTLMQVIALVHQHQRTVHEVEHRGRLVRYVEVEKSDIEMADRLAQVVLPQGMDELPPQTRRLLVAIEALVSSRATKEGIDPSRVRLSRREIREHVGLSHTQVRVHVERLVALEHLVAHVGAGTGRGRAVYELLSSSKPASDGALKGPEETLKGGWRGFEGPRSLQKKPSVSRDNGHVEGLSPSTLQARESKSTAQR